MALSPHLPFTFPQHLTGPQPFELKVNPNFILQTQAKVQSFPVLNDSTSNSINEGHPVAQIEHVVDYWKTEYDWSSVEAQMNKDFDHFATYVNGTENYEPSVPLHFVHQKSEGADAIPILLLHGWPSTHLEWSKVIDPLTRNSTIPFHVVAPDLPGFGFSPAPTQPGLDPREAGKVMDSLMKQLGYSTYGIASTDLGWLVAMWMVRDSKSSIIGHFTDFFLLSPTESDLERLAQNETTPEETAYIAANNEWFTNHSAYATAHTQKPLALSYAFTDSPVGYLAWIWDLMYAVSDGYSYKAKELITDTMMLFIPGPYSNIRWYLESFKPGIQDFPKSEVPTGASLWSFENGPFPEVAAAQLTPRKWIERTDNVVFYTQHAYGGHFPAVSHPEPWTRDVQTFFLSLRQGE
ncbi:hypothetical protein FDECE_14084 [Fusarium decemcellulare]|nr:hypothetical protein FDECE_14084 [Fusarium decemcellulare]